MMGILAFNNIYPNTTLAVFHINLYFFSEMPNILCSHICNRIVL